MLLLAAARLLLLFYAHSDQDMWRLEDRIEGSEHLANRDGSEQRQEGVPVGVNDSSERENQGTEAHIGQVTVIAFSAFPFCVHISIWEACWVYPSAGERVEKGVQALSRFCCRTTRTPPNSRPRSYPLSFFRCFTSPLCLFSQSLTLLFFSFFRSRTDSLLPPLLHPSPFNPGAFC